jgi:hypothetical protein
MTHSAIFLEERAVSGQRLRNGAADKRQPEFDSLITLRYPILCPPEPASRGFLFASTLRLSSLAGERTVSG